MKTLAIIALGVAVLSCDPSHAQSHRIDDPKGTFACASRDYYMQAINLAVQEDRLAFGRHLMKGYGTGECVYFSHGERVFFMDVRLTAGLVSIRRPSETRSYWTRMEAVRTAK